jgi:hypothetical protein
MKVKINLKDETFKVVFSNLYQDKAIVHIGYEIAIPSRKIDLFIEEKDNVPLDLQGSFFDYFKKYNIIEFKSEEDPFLKKDLQTLHLYISAIYLKYQQKNCNETDFTFTLVTSKKIKFLEKIAVEISKGLYKLEIHSNIQVRMVVIEEVPNDKESLDNSSELRALKLFTTPKDRRSYIEYLFNSKHTYEFEAMMFLYLEEISEVFKGGFMPITGTLAEELISSGQMTVREILINNFYERMEKLGITKDMIREIIFSREREKLKAEKQKAEADKQKAEADKQKAELKAERKAKIAERKKSLRTAVNMKKKGLLDIGFIAEVAELDKDYLERFFRKVG